MTSSALSPTEARFVREGVSCGVRLDGRGALTPRGVRTWCGVAPLTHGSARVAVGQGTDVLAAVRVDAAAGGGAAAGGASPARVTVDCVALARGDVWGHAEAMKRAGESRGSGLILARH